MDTTRVGVFDLVGDIGTCRIPGITKYDEPSQSYTVSSGGRNVWGREDEFHFAARRVRGDFLLTVEGMFEGSGINPHRKWGLMIRQEASSSSAYVDAAVHGDGLFSLQFREHSGGDTAERRSQSTAPDIVQLERSGESLVLRAAKRGEAPMEAARLSLGLGDEVFAGIFVCSHEESFSETAVFRNFRLDVPAPAERDPGTGLAASRLEVLGVDSGVRRVVYASPDHFEAPNWSRDGSYMLFNQGGRIYKILRSATRPLLLDTGSVTANNNDHGLSFDGAWLALSSYTELPLGAAGSQIYVVGAAGGEPRRVTDQAPSYWHGWSPDGATLVYCAERGGSFGIHSIDVRGGEERRLTTGPGHDDGPEYSPDGKHIYFNSTRSGKMKIWRMHPDGSGQEQVSPDDEWNDWFPHLSPHGERIIYVSYPPEVKAATHPGDCRVLLRVQSISKREAKVAALLYGGQGTMNVHSWSPDGRSVAFVSYTYGDPGI